MALSNCKGWPHIFYVSVSAAVLGLSLHYPWIDFKLSASLANVWSLAQSNPDLAQHQYQAQIFSRDPLIIIIDSFVSSDEIAHMLRISKDNFEPSKVYKGYDESLYDLEKRVSESAKLNRTDPVVRRVEQRAQRFQGWRGSSTSLEAPTLQRYRVDGFYDYHFDWDPTIAEGNRVTTFMVYLVADCVGGGTNFPFLIRPNDTQWCDVIECTEKGIDGFQGVTFKARAGSAVFWENFHPNGTGHEAVYHAGLPVKSGVKVGLNMWSWDRSWKKSEIFNS